MTEIDSTLIADSEQKKDLLDRFYYSKKKRRLLVWMIVYSALLGALGHAFPAEGPVSTVMVGLPLLVFILQWCFLDAEQHNFHIGKILRISLVLFCLIALPIYLFRTRGLAGVKSIVLACLFYAVLYACTVGSFYLTSLISPEPVR